MYGRAKARSNMTPQPVLPPMTYRLTTTQPSWATKRRYRSILPKGQSPVEAADLLGGRDGPFLGDGKLSTCLIVLEFRDLQNELKFVSIRPVELTHLLRTDGRTVGRTDVRTYGRSDGPTRSPF